MTYYSNILRACFWYSVLVSVPYLIEFLFLGGELGDTSQFLKISIGVMQILLQLGAAYLCIQYGAKHKTRFFLVAAPLALILMVLRRVTAFMIMFGHIPKDSLIPMVDGLFLPITISLLWFLAFYSLRK
jgi:hypothetical protein